MFNKFFAKSSVSSTNLEKHVRFLSEISPPRNCWNFDSLAKCGEYLKHDLSKLKYTVEEQTWQARGNTYSNYVVVYGDPSKEKLIIGAHYDVYGNFPGADDNASGVAGLLELARLLQHNKPALPYAIEMVFYCLEEPPFYGTMEMGSYVHAKSCFEANVQVKGMICLDMIGYFSDAPNSQHYPNKQVAEMYPDKANFIVAIGVKEYHHFLEKIFVEMKIDSQINVEKIEFISKEGLASLSDHKNYWTFGYPAVMINNTAFLRNKNYHEATDTLDTLDFLKMKAVVDAVYRAILFL